MSRLRGPFTVSAIYALLVGLIALSPGLVRAVFGYEVRDQGVRLVFAASTLTFGIVQWAISREADRYAGLAGAIALSYVVYALLLVLGWIQGLYTARNVLGPIVIDIALIAWLWSARRQPSGTA